MPSRTKKQELPEPEPIVAVGQLIPDGTKGTPRDWTVARIEPSDRANQNCGPKSENEQGQIEPAERAEQAGRESCATEENDRSAQNPDREKKNVCVEPGPASKETTRKGNHCN
jgi:hypothetical protein